MFEPFRSIYEHLIVTLRVQRSKIPWALRSRGAASVSFSLGVMFVLLCCLVMIVHVPDQHEDYYLLFIFVNF
jgi:hypothetical protein